jgi:peptide/nickel transport system substrate-binding protein
MNNDLAESVEVSDDALEYTVTLRDDATFHNGDPVTAEDVKFTFEWLTDNAGTFLDAPRIDLTVDAVDDTTAVFNLENPYAPLVSRDFHNWGILHRETWVDAGALDDAAGAQPGADMVGSGPFELTQFSSGQGATLEPYEDHHLFDPQATLNFSVYRDGNTAFQALNGGDVDIFTVNPPQLDQLVEGDSEEVDTIRGSALSSYILMPQCSASPTKFHEFRDGIATALDYQEIMAVAWAGLAEPQMYAHFLDQAHPIFTDDPDSLYEQGNGDPTGDVEAAKQILEDEGWTWDSDGNLRYPQDADLTALWPAEESPDPENYPCLNEDRQVVQSDEVELPIELPETV